MESAEVLEELNAALHFMKEFRQQNRPIKTQDAHNSLVKAPDIKKFLQAKWKLSELGVFFKTYPQFFKVEKDGNVFLKDQDFKLEELECIQSFFDLLRKRNNRPIHVLNACCFVSSTSVNDYLKANYNVQDLSQFFASHLDFFSVIDGFVSIKICTEAATPAATIPVAVHQETKVKSSADTSLSRAERRYEAYMEKKALNFYVLLIDKHTKLSVKQAHSYLQNNVELREHLKQRYPLKDLTPFFAKYPKNFVLLADNVYLTISAKISVSANSTEQSGNLTSLSQTPSSSSKTGSGTSSPSLTSEQKAKGKTTPVSSETVEKNSSKNNTWSNSVFESRQLSKLLPSLITSSPRPSDMSSPSLTSEPKPKGKTTPVLPETVEKNSSKNNSWSNSVSENSQLSKLLPSLITSSPRPSALNSSTIKETRDGRSARFQDAACQTVSSGPILSLNVFQEIEKSLQ